MTVSVELTREIDGPGVLAALRASGLEGELAEGGWQLVVRGENTAAIVHCLDGWISERRLPFVPVRVDNASYALVPPAG